MYGDYTEFIKFSVYFTNVCEYELDKPVIETMPKHCIAGYCNRTAEGRFSLPKDAARRTKWSNNVGKARSDWPVPTDQSVLYRLHFFRDYCENYGNAYCTNSDIYTVGPDLSDHICSLKRMSQSTP